MVFGFDRYSLAVADIITANVVSGQYGQTPFEMCLNLMKSCSQFLQRQL